MDRWDVVNYLRALQGVNGKTVATGPLAPPGVTGDKVPGPTRMGPNVPAPFFNPRSLLSGDQATAAPAQATGGQVPAVTSPADTTARARIDSAKAKTSSTPAKTRR
jgi:hypothetical protein